MNFNFKHEWIETNIGLMAVLTMLAISVGGLVEIAPLFFIDRKPSKKSMACAPTRRWNSAVVISITAKAVICAIRR